MRDGNFKFSMGKLIMLILVLMIIISGGTFAYLQWSTSSEQQTEVVFTSEQYFTCSADGGGNITSNDVNLVPTSCTNSEHAIQRTIIANPTLNTDDTNVTMNLWLDINDIGTGLSNSDNFRYTLTTTENDCTRGIVNYGTFTGKTDGDQILLLDQKMYSTTITDTYYLYVWLDSDETSTTTMNQTFDLSLNGNCTNASKGEPFYAVYSADDTSLRFYKENEGVITEGSTYNNLTVTNVYKAYENDVYTYDSSTTATTSPWDEIRESVTTVVIEDEISPHSTASWFKNFLNTTNLDVTNLDVSNTVNMSRMFDGTGKNVTKFTITGLDNWNVSNVTSMRTMFQNTGYSATEWDIGSLSNWDTSNVIDMSYMFFSTGYSTPTFNIGDLSNWNTKTVISMYGMFYQTGYNATTWNIGDLSEWNVSRVRNMYGMFNRAGKHSLNFNIGNIGNWNVSEVTDMNAMFANTGDQSTTFNIGTLSNWDVSKVTNMYAMFASAGYNATTFDIGNLSNWNTCNVKDMAGMFKYAGYSASTFNIGNLNNWNVSNVINMGGMFEQTGYTATNWSQDLSNWNVDKVTIYTDFNTGIETKVTPPVWVNEDQGTTE